MLPALGSIQMVVSDLLSEDRRGVEEAFKRLHPERTVLMQHDGVDGAWMFLPQQLLEDWGVWPVTAEMAQRGGGYRSRSRRSGYGPSSWTAANTASTFSTGGSGRMSRPTRSLQLTALGAVSQQPVATV